MNSGALREWCAAAYAALLAAAAVAAAAAAAIGAPSDSDGVAEVPG
jgi:hypothetical protein